MNPGDPDDRTVASAEFVLGTLSDADREEFLARLRNDPALQAEVGYWQDRLLGLTRRVQPVEPSDSVWQAIEAALPAVEPKAVVPRPASERSTRTEVAKAAFWNRLGFWRGFSALAVAASLLLASMLLLRPPVTAGAQYVAVLQGPDMRPGWIVQAADRGPVKLVPLADLGPIPAGRSWQFWTKGKDAAGPTSLGLLPAGGTVEVPRERLPDLGDEQLFEITLEPEAGSPIGRPTGPILFVGKARRV